MLVAYSCELDRLWDTLSRVSWVCKDPDLNRMGDGSLARRFDRGPRKRYQGLWVGQKFPVRVVRVIDGRTVHVESVLRPHDYRVRLYGIRVPDKGRNDPYWKESADFLSGLVLDKEMAMEVKDFDIKSRQIVALLSDDLMPFGSVSHAMMAEGWAFCDPSDLTMSDLRGLESGARSFGKGMWQD